MTKHSLFLLPPGFEDNHRREFCPECAELWGVLHYYPALKESVSIQYVGIAHPRSPICDILGEGRWNAPTLVFSPDATIPEQIEAKMSNGVRYLGSARDIARYFAATFGTAMPRGS